MEVSPDSSKAAFVRPVFTTMTLAMCEPLRRLGADRKRTHLPCELHRGASSHVGRDAIRRRCLHVKASDFIVEDNGVPQKIQSDEDFNQEPVSVIVAIQTGRTSLIQFQKFSKIGPLLDLFLGKGHGEAAIVTFDSQPELLTDFTSNTETFQVTCKSCSPVMAGLRFWIRWVIASIFLNSSHAIAGACSSSSVSLVTTE